MGLETATFLNELNPLNPEFDDLLKESDDHHRLIKQVLQNTFPDAAGAIPISGDGSNIISTGGFRGSPTAGMEIGSVLFAENADHLFVPGAGFSELWYSTDGNLYWTNPAGIDESLSGHVSVNGTPLINQLALWDDAMTQRGDANLTFNGTIFNVGGDITLSGTVDGRDVAGDGTTLTNHVGDATLHFTEASIDHTAILNIGTNSHAAIDTHIADATLHFTEASISITESQISDLFTTIAPLANPVFTGSFTSPGIDDNASGERLQISDGAYVIGANDVAQFGMQRASNTGSFVFAGGSSSFGGASFALYGGAHSTRADDWEVRAGVNTMMTWDESTGIYEVLTGIGSKTAAMTLDASQNANFGADVGLLTGSNFTSATAAAFGLKFSTVDEWGVRINRNGTAELFYNNAVKAATLTDGLQITGDLKLTEHIDKTTTGSFDINHLVSSQLIRILTDDSVSAAHVNATFGGATPEVELYFDGAGTAKTVAAASGGLEANNTETGAGYERVLTESDIAIAAPVALANSATPSVTGGGRLWLTGGTTTITDLTSGVEGQEVIILSEHAITISDNANFFLAGGDGAGAADFVMANTDSLHLVQKADGNWYEISRSVN